MRTRTIGIRRARIPYLTIARLDAAARLIVAALVDPRWRLEIEAEATIPVQVSRG